MAKMYMISSSNIMVVYVFSILYIFICFVFFLMERNMIENVVKKTKTKVTKMSTPELILFLYKYFTGKKRGKRGQLLAEESRPH